MAPDLCPAYTYCTTRQVCSFLVYIQCYTA
ncbi:hypothetical protein CIB84_010599 [Bambusicola thoracicus]|uniref:Uncharacterized protein n=1 Tax=Bambusicola thoracicus TaxID=9083 RepID=A0A2P4SNF3_BAMTH|nr:hypothetical protein CIB84_010599 [Bambusicola thoracicus]